MSEVFAIVVSFCILCMACGCVAQFEIQQQSVRCGQHASRDYLFSACSICSLSTAEKRGTLVLWQCKVSGWSVTSNSGQVLAIATVPIG